MPVGPHDRAGHEEARQLVDRVQRALHPMSRDTPRKSACEAIAADDLRRRRGARARPRVRGWPASCRPCPESARSRGRAGVRRRPTAPRPRRRARVRAHRRLDAEAVASQRFRCHPLRQQGPCLVARKPLDMAVTVLRPETVATLTGLRQPPPPQAPLDRSWRSSSSTAASRCPAPSCRPATRTAPCRSSPRPSSPRTRSSCATCRASATSRRCSRCSTTSASTVEWRDDNEVALLRRRR